MAKIRFRVKDPATTLVPTDSFIFQSVSPDKDFHIEASDLGLALKKQSGQDDAESLAVSSDTTLTNAVPAKGWMKLIKIKNNTGVAQRINIGTTVAGTDLIDDYSIPGNDIKLIQFTEYFSETLAQSIHISDAVGGWVSNLDVNVYYEIL